MDSQLRFFMKGARQKEGTFFVILDMNKKQKFNLISSIISLAVTSLLLVFICLAWFVTNKEATANGLTASTAIIEPETESLVAKVEYYYVENVSGNSYTIGEKYDGLTSNLEMGAYDALSGEPYHLLLKVVLNQTNLEIAANINSLFYNDPNYSNLVTEDEAGKPKYRFLGSSDEDNIPYREIQHKGNPLSSIIGFYYITNVVDNQFTISDDNQMATFVQKSGNTYEDLLNENISICDDTGEDPTIYILFAYEEGAIEDIYSANLGSENLEPVEDESDEHWKDIEYICDFKISINKGGN